MAASATPPLLHHPDASTPLYPRTHKQKPFSFSHSLRNHQISVRKLYSYTPTDSIDTRNPNSHLRQLCLYGQLQEALHCLDFISQLQVPVDEETYIELLHLCEWNKAAEGGAKVQSHISSTMTHLSLRLGNALLSMLVRFSNLVDAWFVFGRMVQRDVFSWNVLIGGYAKAGFFDEALNLYDRMLWAGMRPDLYTFPCVSRTCGGSRDLVRGKGVHVHVFRFGFELHIDVLNSLITMYSKCGNIGCARKVFDGMPTRNRISWNAMISGSFENGSFLEGLNIFFTMRAASVFPDLMTMTSVISACKCESLPLGKELHAYAIKTKFESEVSVSNSLMEMYSSIQKLNEAEKLFSRMELRDVVSWTVMICGCADNGYPEKSLDIYRVMVLENISPDEIVLASVLSSCASLNQLEVGIRLHKLACETGLILYPIVANSLIDMYSKCGSIESALEVFRQIEIRDRNSITWTSMITGLRINDRNSEVLLLFRQMKLKPNSITLVSVLSACSRIGSLISGKEIHGYALRRGLEFQIFLPNCILDMYVRCGRMREAWNLFHTMLLKDISSWNIMFTGFAERGQGERALNLFSKMTKTPGINVDDITFVSLLHACSRSGMETEGFKIFNTMESKYGIVPNLKHHGCMVDLLSRKGRLEEACVFIKEMTIKPDAAIWGALLNGCRIHRNVELGEVAANHIFEMGNNVSPGYYVLLCKLYSASEEWEKVATVRKVMKEGGIVAESGCSWVEIKGKVHAFLTDDVFHPQIKEINAVLEGFYEKMDAGLVSSVKASSSKDEIFCGHSERLGIGFSLINTPPGMPIWVTKNLYMCESCHTIIKFISKVVRRHISVRDTEEFHHFKDGVCSCGE